MEENIINESYIIKDKLVIENTKFKNENVLNDYIYFLDETEVIIKNCEFNLTNISDINIFNLSKSKLIIENCIFKIDTFLSNKNKNIIIFNLDTGSELELLNSKIYLLNSFFNYNIIHTKLSKIKIYNSFLEKNRHLDDNTNNNNYLIKNIYSIIDIDNSILINNNINGQIINMINLDLIFKFKFFELIEIKNQQLIIDYNIKNIVITEIKSIIIDNIKYIFLNYNIKNNKIIFNLDNISDNIENKIIKNKLIEYLFSIIIKNSYLKESDKNSILNAEFKYSNNYYINIINSNITTKTNIFCNLLYSNNKLLGTKINNNGELFTNKIHSKFIYGNGLYLDNLGLKKYNNNLSLHNDKKIKGNNNINFSNNLNLNGNNNIIFGKNNKILGKNNFINGYNNNLIGHNNNILGNGIKGKYNNCILLGNYNNNEHSYSNNILEIGNGTKNNRKTILSINNENIIKINGTLNVNNIECDNIHINNNNILGIDNIEIDDNIFCNGNINTYNIEGINENINKNINKNIIYNNILNIQGETITFLQLDLKNLIVPIINNGIIGYNNLNSCLLNFDENKNGLIYKCEIMCIEQPNFNSLNFKLSHYKNLYKGININNLSDYNIYNNIDLFYSNNWKKGMKKEFHNFENNNSFNYQLYLTKDNQKHENETILTKRKVSLKVYSYSLF